jgi:hypothetical protein
MALATYSDLQTSVANWLHRSDLTSVIPDLISIAEMRMNSDVIARDMDTTATMNTVAGVNYLVMPSDVTESRLVQITSTDPKHVLEYLPFERMAVKYPSSSQATPEAFAVSGANMYFAPIPDAAYTISYTYRQRIPSLSNSNTTNWLLTKWPHAYLYATLCAAAPYLGQDQRVAIWESQYQGAVQDINSVDWYSGTLMAVKAL